MGKSTKEDDETKNGKREVEGETERVAVVCKRACCGPRSGSSGQVFEAALVEVLGDESEVIVCSHLCVSVLISLVDMVRELDLSVSEFRN